MPGDEVEEDHGQAEELGEGVLLLWIYGGIGEMGH